MHRDTCERSGFRSSSCHEYERFEPDNEQGRLLPSAAESARRSAVQRPSSLFLAGPVGVAAQSRPRKPMSSQLRRWTLIAVAMLWVVAVARGARELVKYE